MSARFVGVSRDAERRKTVPAASSSLISPALEQLQDLPAGDRVLLAGQYPGDHILADTEAIGDVMNWFAGRFEGLPATSNC